MKDIMYFYLRGCPYCHKADAMVAELIAEDERYRQIRISAIEESANMAVADLFDYYYVPCFYVDGIKKHEGVPTKEKIRAVLDEALK
ncbi:MAG: thioredoxin family protein [Oscillospiraceae bacterium]